MSDNIELSIVSPVYKAANLVEKLVEQVTAQVEQITPDYEIILVEDCGGDGSWEKIKTHCEKNKKVKGIRLSRNFGQQHAIQAGLDASSGTYVVTMDCDLQDRPDQIKTLYQKAQEGYEIVVASRQDRQDTWLKKLLSRLFYNTLGYLTDTDQDSSVANFILYHRKAVDALSQMHDHSRYYPMLFQLIGFNAVKVPVLHAEREDGKSSYSFKKRLNLAINTILTFSDKPLRLTIKFGVILAFLSFCSALILVIAYFISDITVRGWSSLALLISFFSGIIVAALGVVGLYVGMLFQGIKNRPTYIVHERLN